MTSKGDIPGYGSLPWEINQNTKFMNVSDSTPLRKIPRSCSNVFQIETFYRVSQKGIDKKLLVGAALDFNSQFLNLFGFSISVSFVWCVI